MTPNGYRQIGTVKNAYTLVKRRDAGWGVLHIPGYARQDANGVIHHDDIYVATGPGSRARVEIGNSSTYNRCTNLSICTVDNWSNSQISATVRSGSFRAGPAYIFVIDAGGNISSGFPIKIQAGSNPIPADTIITPSKGAKIIDANMADLIRNDIVKRDYSNFF